MVDGPCCRGRMLLSADLAEHDREMVLSLLECCLGLLIVLSGFFPLQFVLHWLSMRYPSASAGLYVECPALDLLGYQCGFLVLFEVWLPTPCVAVMASQTCAYGLQEWARPVRHYFLLVYRKKQFESDNLGSGEMCPRLWKLISPSLLFSFISTGEVWSGTVSLVALLRVPSLWGTSSWFAGALLSNLFSF